MSRAAFSKLIIPVVVLAVAGGAALAESPKPVIVENESHEPVPVTGTVTVEVKDKGTLFQEQFSGIYGTGVSSWRAESEVVPEGKRRMIEFLTLAYTTSTSLPSQGVCRLFVLDIPGCQGSLANQVAIRHQIPTLSGYNEEGDGIDVSNALRTFLFLDEGQSLCVICPLPDDNNTISGGSVTIVGRMVDMPQD
jgi:hypothetical protein